MDYHDCIAMTVDLKLEIFEYESGRVNTLTHGYRYLKADGSVLPLQFIRTHLIRVFLQRSLGPDSFLTFFRYRTIFSFVHHPTFK